MITSVDSVYKCFKNRLDLDLVNVKPKNVFWHQVNKFETLLGTET